MSCLCDPYKQQSVKATLYGFTGGSNFLKSLLVARQLVHARKETHNPRKTASYRFYTAVFVQLKQMRYILIGEL